MSNPLRTLAPLIALVSALAYLLLPHQWFGYEASRWNVLRRRVFPTFDQLKRDHTDGYAMYSLPESEYAGTVDASVRDVGIKLDRAGYTRMPLSALKRDHTGDLVERASWSKRESLFAPDQVHVMLFDTGDHTRVYAHHERNAYSPRYAYEHYTGIGLDAQRGIEEVRRDLPGV